MDRTTAYGFVQDGNGNNVFVDENLAAGVDGADVDAVWLNGVQEEIQALQRLDGYVPVPGDDNQMLAALVAKFPGIVAAGRSENTGYAGTAGYIKLPGGLILQWIRNKIGMADSTGAYLNSWVFPVPFGGLVLGYSYVTTNENAGNSDAGTIQAGAPTLVGQPIAHLRCPPGAQVAFSGFVIGV